jgi:hypothetical protein
MPLLTEEIERRMTAYKDKEGNKDHRLPRFDTVAKSLGVSNADAKTMLNEYRTKHEGRVRMEPVVKEPLTAEPPKPKWYTILIANASKVSDWAIDSGTVLLAVVLNLVLCGLSLWIMGPSDLEKLGFVAVAFIVVLFGLRALVKGNFWLWLRCELIAGFLGVSFILVGLDYQTNLTADDRQLTALENAETTARDYLKVLQDLQKEKGEGYKSQVDTQQIRFDTASALAGAYRVQVANKPKKAPEIKAYDILLAIPKAVLGSKVQLSNDVAMWIALGLFGLVFYILPETLYTTVVRKKE